MGMKSADAQLLKVALLSGAKELEAKKEWINELNVFPVPDGDTGTNMTMTIMAAAREVAAIENPTMETIAKALSSGSLRGARGNSGVILSQLFRGFTKEIKEASEINVTILANAFTRATETAYKAVMKPKEGTILTVARGMADKAVELAIETDDIVEFLEKVIEHGDYVLSQTPEMLPVLKQAGVVDSGGQGLMQVLKGALDGVLGKGIPFDAVVAQTSQKAAPVGAARDDIDTADIKFGYCTEFIINVEHAYDDDEELKFKAFLESIGDSIVVVSDEDVVKVHVHTNNPGLAIERALTYGSLSRMKIDNMREEHNERLEMAASAAPAQEAPKAEEPRKEYGFIAVSVGEGLSEIFKGIGADYMIEGGQTMNPSTEDMINAIDKVNADVIYIFPNNKNIILAAEQAKYLVEDKQIIFPSPENIKDLPKMIKDAGGIEVCYGGIGIHGHVAFNEPGPGVAKSNPRILEINDFTRTIDSTRHSGVGGNLENFPRRAITMGMKQCLEARKMLLMTRNETPTFLWANTILRIAALGKPGDDYPVTHARRHKNLRIVSDYGTAQKPKYNI